MRVYLLDMGSLCAWLYFAHPEGDDGMTKALAVWLDEFTEKFRPSHVVACFDAGNNFRNTIDPEYKLNRKTKPKPENFIAQLQAAPELVKARGLQTMRVDTFEADDCIATLAVRFSDEAEVMIVSEDKDLFCLIGDNVKQFAPRDGKFYDAAAVIEKHGFPPWRVPDFLAMAGDSSDNIKGIAKIGEVTAKYVCQNTKTMAEAFRKASRGEFKDLKAATQKLLAEGREQFDHAMKLVTLRYDVPTELTIDDCKIATSDEVAA